MWNPPNLDAFKCNADGDSKENPSPRSRAFFIRNGDGNLIYAKVRKLEYGTNLITKVVTLRLGLEYFIVHNFLPLTLKTDSLTLNKILGGI